MTDRTLSHSTFVIERDYPVPVSKVFAAFADPAVKSRWFGADDTWTTESESFDFREGGLEHQHGRWANGTTSQFDARYVEIVENLRIVYSYEMHVNGGRLSVSISSVEFAPTASGTRLKLTEQGTFFDDLDNPAQREEGTGQILDALGRILAEG